MQETAQGGFGGFGLTELDQIAREDNARLANEGQRKQTVNRRHGIKGARQWGYASFGTGKRGKRS